ncbi:MAG TPA: metal-sensitive transcriptional regulator [Anaerolineae bacterium]|nr:metal-sensitive transcriptional regulator [Anaerolineae bacterium]
MREVSPSAKADLANRLSKIEGQARGVQNMLDQGQSCQDILHQLLAIRSAAHQATLVLVQDHALEYLRRAGQSISTEETVESFVRALASMPY